MRKQLIALVLMISMCFMGCDRLEDKLPTENASEEHIEEDYIEANENNETLSISMEETDLDSPDQTTSISAENDIEEEPLTYIERDIGKAMYTIPEEWYMEERDDRGMIEHTYFEFDNGRANDFMAVWYLPLWKEGDTAEETIEKILTYTKSDHDCDQFNVKRSVLDSGLKVTEYQYHISDINYEESGFYIPVRDDGVLMIFYDPRRIYDDEYSSEIAKVVASVKMIDKTTDNQSQNLAKESKSNHTKNDNGHAYYTNVSADGIEAAEAVAQQIASSIMSDNSYTTDLQRVTAAAMAVKGYCDKAQYGRDEMKYYRSPYGVFVAGVYTCAGSTRALGRVLDYMGFSWQHNHENENRHQWCTLTMDGQIGFADGMSGVAGYGALTNGMTLPDGSQIFFIE